MFTVLVYVCIAAAVCLHLSAFSLRPSAKRERFKFDRGSERHLSRPYLWIMERFSGIPKFRVDSPPLPFIAPCAALLHLPYIIPPRRPRNIHTSHMEEHTYMNTNMHQHANPPPVKSLTASFAVTHAGWKDWFFGWSVGDTPALP